MDNKVYHDEDVSLDVLKDKVVAVLGYGIQGGPQALCLRDSGLNVIVGAGPRDRFPDWDKAEADGFEVMSIAEATGRADVIHVLLADPAQPAVYNREIRNNLKPNATLSFAHGFNILYGAIVPPKDVNVVLFVPNSPGHMVRKKFLEGSGIYGAVSVDQDVTGEALDIALAIAKGVGSTRVGVVELSFQHETEGDNFEEQVLYGGTIHLMKAVFNTMVENGYPPFFAYAKAIRSLRTVIDVMDEIGIEAYISERSSRTCEFAVRMTGPRVIDYEEIQKVFEETERGEFAARWMEEWQLGMPRLQRMRRTGADSKMEETGHEWRDLFGEG
ncbi:ketol-acid reductoisomerase [Aggregatilinea lenta]|uniref:ketol-acid reductoisomerase n=1 Tax=Aggregatilinea lenta TaxID=913108 RepID=UPI000E5B4AED|nr:ketol-acid reductoisomerase [Aggregatilinea lenta]